MKRKQSSARTKVLNGPAAALVALGAVLGSSAFLASTAGAATTPDTVAGGAFGLSATVGSTAVIPATPSVTLPATGAAQSSTSVSIPSNAYISSFTATVKTAGTGVGTAGEQVKSSASVQTLVGTFGSTGIKVSHVTSTCTADATGSTGTATITGLTLGGHAQSTTSPIAPTTVLPPTIPGVTVTLNHQVVSDTAGSASITVDGLYVQLGTGTGPAIPIGESSCTTAGAGILNPPTATGLTPTTGATNGGTPVTITGTNFYGPASVTFGSTPATNVKVVSPTEITANSPGGSAGTVSVTVKTPEGTPATAGSFTYVAVPVAGSKPPTVTGISPTSGTPSGGGTIVIKGTDLCTVSAVFFGSTPAPSFTVSPTCKVLTVTVPPGTAGTVPVTITTLGGTATAPEGYTYIQSGYWMTATDGGVFSFGGAKFYGSTGSMTLNQPIVAMADTPDHGGYWLFAADGGVFAFGDAHFYGSVPGVLGPEGRTLNKPIVAAEATPNGQGYRLFAADGGVFDFGNATFTGSLPGLGVTLNKPITAAASTPVGQGYWLTAADGGVFTFGSAVYHGSMGGTALNSPVAAMSATPNGQGYWVFATDGGVFNFGNAVSYGSMGGKPLNAPVAYGVSTSTGDGYWLFGADGGVFTFGDAQFEGSLGGTKLNKPIVGGIGF